LDDIPQDKYKVIDNIEDELERLRNQRTQLRSDWRTWAERRNSLNSELKELREKVRTLKSERDAVNAEVKTLKTSRDQIRAEIAEKRNRIAQMVAGLKQLRSQVQGTFKQAKNSLEELEWKMQTSSLDSREENRLINQIKELELRVAEHKQMNELQAALTEEKAVVESLKLNAQSIHQKMLAAAETSARVHEEMMQLVRKLDEIKATADVAHKMYLQTRNDAERSEQELVQKVLEKKKLRKEIFGDEEAERLRKGEELAARLAESGSAKLSQGKRLSFEEFKALMERRKI